MFNNKPLQAAAVLAATIFTAASVEAQHQSRYGVQYTSQPSQYMGGTAFSYGNVRLYKNGSYASATAELYVTNTIKFFHQTKQVASVSAVASSRGRPGMVWSLASFKADVNGERILSRNYIRGNHDVVDEPLRVFSKLWHHDIFIAIPVGPVTVLTSGNANSLLRVWECRMEVDSDVDAEIDARVQVGAYGYVNFVGGIAGASVGVQGQSIHPNHLVTFDAEAEADDGLSGSMDMVVSLSFARRLRLAQQSLPNCLDRRVDQVTDVRDAQTGNAADFTVAQVAMKLQTDHLLLLLRQAAKNVGHLAVRLL